MTPAALAPTRARKWFVVILLALGMVIAYVDRANLSVVLALPDFRQLFRLTDADRGVLNSAFFWTYALLQIPAGWLIDRYGAKIPYAAGFLFWGIVSAATGLVQNVNQLIGARLLLGIGESVSTAASLRWIRCNCKEEERGLATGILFSGTKFGAAIGAPVTAFLVTRFNWRLMFLITGLGGLIWLVGWVGFVERDGAGPKRAGFGRGHLTAFNHISPRVMCGIVLGTFAYNYFIYFCLTWLPSYLVEARHLSLTSMSLYTMFSFGGMAVVGILAGWAADRLIGRGLGAVRVRKTFTILGFVMASTEVFGALSGSRSVALFFAVFSLSGLGLATANYWALTQTLVPAGAIGRVVGVQNFASNISGAVAAFLTGWLKQITGNYEAPMLAVLAILLLGLFSYGWLVKTNLRMAPDPAN
jgi:MFS transporter, ACS family, D-galactonate transporter